MARRKFFQMNKHVSFEHGNHFCSGDDDHHRGNEYSVRST